MAKKKSKKKVVIITILIIIAALAVIMVLFSQNGDKGIKVTTSKVTRRTIVQTVSAVGKVQPETSVKISSETSGEIVFLGVKEGDTVKAGQMLIRIKPDIVESQLEQYKAAAESAKISIDYAKATLEKAQADFKRVTELFNKKFASQLEFDQAKASYSQANANYLSSMQNYEQSKAALNQVKRSAERTVIYSPINGIVTSLLVEKGEKVVGTAQYQGTELMTVADLNVMNSEVEVDENDIINVKIGDTANVEIDALPDKVFRGYVIEIGHSAATSGTGTQDEVTNFKVKIRLLDPEGKLRPGMSSNVDIETEKRINVLSVPLMAVTIRDGNKKEADDDPHEAQVKTSETKTISSNKHSSVVFTKNQNKAKIVKVKTGVSDSGFIEILEGLSEGQEIISGSFMAVSKELNDGSVIIVEQPKASVAKPEKK